MPGQTLLWPFFACPERQRWRGFRVSCEGRQLPVHPSFHYFLTLCALRSLFLRRATFARALQFKRVSGILSEREHAQVEAT